MVKSDIDRFLHVSIGIWEGGGHNTAKKDPTMRQQQKDLLVPLLVNTACFGIHIWIHLIQL